MKNHLKIEIPDDWSAEDVSTVANFTVTIIDSLLDIYDEKIRRMKNEVKSKKQNCNVTSADKFIDDFPF